MQTSKWLRYKRIAAGLGLREFAEMIGDSPSNVCNIENGSRKPWQNEPKLRRVAEALAIREYSDEWDTLFRLVKPPGQPPADLARIMETPNIPVLLRTVQECQLSRGQIEKVVKYVKKLGRENGKSD